MLKLLILGVGIVAASLLGADYAERGPRQDDPPAQRGIKGRCLVPKVDTLKVEYIAWGCYCPPWSTEEVRHKYSRNPDQRARHCIFIEPATPAQELPEDFVNNPTRFDVRVVGQFYARRAYPEGLLPYEAGGWARIFRYTCYELEEQNPFRPQDDMTLVVSYGAISCPCPQWATRPEEEPFKRGYIYLEPATSLLPVADKLWDGTHLPLRLLVTGQFVSQSGYPKGYVATKGEPESGPVFRYRSLKVLPNQRKAGVRKR